MKKTIQSVFAIVAAALIGALLYYSTLLPRKQAPADITVDITPAKIERGRYLAVNVLQCIDCHSERDWTLYGGPPMEPLGAGRKCLDRTTRAAGVNVGERVFPGKMCIRNITQDDKTGIGAWTDGEIIRAVREGVGREGQGLFPIMPYFIYRNVADEDIQAVIAYLRTLPAVGSIQPERKVDFPMSAFIKLLPEPLYEKVPLPDRSDRIAYGQYLSKIARCEFCHSPRAPRSMVPIEGRAFGGGMPFFLNGRTMYTMNLTPHQTGLGAWSEQQFVNRFKRHAQPGPADPKNNTLMNWSAFAGMSEDDLRILYEFFMSLPAVPYVEEPI